MKRIIFIAIAATSLFFQCQNQQNEEKETTQLTIGDWRGVLKPQGVELPFLFEVEESGGAYTIILKNAEERIPLDDVKLSGDSVHIKMYIFDATIHAKVTEDKLQGVWVKDYLEDYKVPFEATFGEVNRFKGNAVADFSGKWEVDFITEQETEKAIAIFEPYEGKMKGTFLTPTGDYRFLEGAVDGDSLRLSCFDGTHAYLFTAALDEDGQLHGNYWSGRTWHQVWTAKRNDSFELPDPYAYTHIKEGYDQFEFKFPSPTGDLVELTDEKYHDKVVVVQLLGSWCPNCMDETKFYVDWIEKNKNKDVEFIGLAFERKADASYAFGRIEKMKNKLEVPYEILLAGSTSAESKAKALPMLNKIMSFPTSIILDKQHKVRQIHTGFAGPGTGEYYERYVERFNLLIDKLISE